MQRVHDDAAEEDVLVDTSKLHLHKTSSSALLTGLARETSGNSPNSDQGLTRVVLPQASACAHKLRVQSVRIRVPLLRSRSCI